MGMAQLVVTAVLVEGRSKSEVARTYGVSRRWVITLVQRFLRRGRTPAWCHGHGGRAAAPAAPPRPSRTRSSRCARTSTAPATRPAPPPSPLTCNNATAPTRCRRCRRSGGSCPPADSSPHNRTNARNAASTASPPNSPNERWQLDITHYRLADGTDVEILNIIDDHSRLCVASTARRVFTAGDVDTVFGKVLHRGNGRTPCRRTSSSVGTKSSAGHCCGCSGVVVTGSTSHPGANSAIRSRPAAAASPSSRGSAIATRRSF